MKTNLLKLTCGLALLGAVASASAQSSIADITVSGSAPGTVALTLLNDVSFTITNTTGDAFILTVFENSVPINASQIFATASASTLQMSVNGGTLYPLSNWVDGGYINNAMTADDSYMWAGLYDRGAVAVGSTVILHAGTITATVPAGFDVMASGSYNLFLADGNGKALTAVAPVPEPTTLALAALGGASLLLLRRRK